MLYLSTAILRNILMWTDWKIITKGAEVGFCVISLKEDKGPFGIVLVTKADIRYLHFQFFHFFTIFHILLKESDLFVNLDGITLQPTG